MNALTVKRGAANEDKNKKQKIQRVDKMTDGAVLAVHYLIGRVEVASADFRAFGLNDSRLLARCIVLALKRVS